MGGTFSTDSGVWASIVQDADALTLTSDGVSSNGPVHCGSESCVILLLTHIDIHFSGYFSQTVGNDLQIKLKSQLKCTAFVVAHISLTCVFGSIMALFMKVRCMVAQGWHHVQ